MPGEDLKAGKLSLCICFCGLKQTGNFGAGLCWLFFLILLSSIFCPVLCPRSQSLWVTLPSFSCFWTSSWVWPMLSNGAELEARRLEQQKYLFLLLCPRLTVVLSFSAALCLQLLSGGPSSQLSSHHALLTPPFSPLFFEIKGGNTSLWLPELECQFPLAPPIPV